ncbi:FAD-binding domain-containing protein [Corynespora cassiicola Philippines]|uniref:FAD-binding domain-containing protein n=1 Tax=Corynespora cassiicola Philippines TaxID=1448308 RepID=A0A2T2P193_CORCC|nr:FAD-binding domain-containing protein [Corynespora cassiicola Philippines]
MASSRSFKAQALSLLLCLAPASVLGQTAQQLQSCLTQEGVRTTVSTDASWTSDTASFQLRLPREPVAIAFPQDREEIAIALSCARNASVKVSALSRAHSFQGYGFGNPGNLVIDVDAFTEVSYDEATTEFTYGGGSNVGPTLKYLWDNHGRHFPHVRGSHVGLVGSSIGGGFGPTSRFLGTPLDNLVAVEYLLPNGTIVKAGPESDLLWAAQGAGANFGIILSATTKTHEVPNMAVNYTLALGTVDSATASAALIAVQDYVLSGNAPDELSLRFSLGNSGSSGFFYGDLATFDQIIEPLVTSIRAIVPTANITRQQLPTFWDAEVASTGAGMNSPTGGSLGGRPSLVQSWVVTNDTPLTPEQADALINSYRSNNRTDVTNTGFLDLWGGISRDLTDSETSWVHGGNLWLIRVDGVGANNAWPEDGVAYMQGLMKPFEESLKASGPLRGFPNYLDSELPVEEWSARLFASNFERLQQIKAEIDPTGMFSGYGLAIPTAGN